MRARSSNADPPGVARLSRDVSAAVTRKTPGETRLAGAVRVLGPLLPEAAPALADACARLVRRRASARPLFVAGAEALLEAEHDDGAALAESGLTTGEDIPLGLCAAAARSRASSLDAPLTRLAASKQAHLAYGAELALAARGAARGARLAELGPRLRESSRIAVIEQVVVPLVDGATLAPSAAPHLAILRDAERHLGRWLALAELAHRSGDPGPLVEAEARSRAGSASSRVSWALLAWALRGGPPPKARPTFDLLARLSDRPTTKKDLSFLHRLGQARVPEIEALLRATMGDGALVELDAVRAARALALNYDHDGARARLIEAAEGRRDATRGPATAALFDLGERERALTHAGELMEARATSAFAWGALVQLASIGRARGPLLTERVARALSGGA